jgi:hypothetical protein
LFLGKSSTHSTMFFWKVIGEGISSSHTRSISSPFPYSTFTTKKYEKGGNRISPSSGYNEKDLISFPVKELT